MNGIKTFGFVSAYNPFEDRFAWSGTLYKIRQGIQNAGFDVVWFPINANTGMEKIYKIAMKLKQKLTGKNILLGEHRPFICKLQAHSVKIDENYRKCDAFFFAGGAQRALFMDLMNKPVVYYTDATFHIMIDYYWKNLSQKEMEISKNLEKKATNLATINIRSSKWAADSVVNDCGFDASKNFVLEFGANIDSCDIKPIAPFIKGKLNVFFSGVDWVRKGGDVAVDVILCLRKMGVDANLIIAGIKNIPEKIRRYDFICNVGFLDKNNPDSYKKYVECWKKSHLLLLPTQAECSAIVYCEAAGFGVPAYTYLTGGTADYVKDGVNGRTFAPGTSAADIAKKIKEDVDSGNLLHFHRDALKLYENKLSWTAWSKRFKDIIERSNFFN